MARSRSTASRPRARATKSATRSGSPAPPGKRDYTVAGIGEFGSSTPLGGASLVEFTLAEAQRLTGKRGRVDEIDATAAEGTTAASPATAISAALPADEVEVRTGEQTAEEDAGDIQEGFGFLSTALLVFAGIAVFVGAFLIFSTFSITVAQRMREFAMLRTLGASSRQVMAAVLIEAALVGLLASLLGIAGGFGFVELIKGLFKAMGFELPTSGLALEASTVAIAIAVGVLTTVAALNPALRATRVAPLEALVEARAAQARARALAAADDHRVDPRRGRRRLAAARPVRDRRHRDGAATARPRTGPAVHRPGHGRRPVRGPDRERARLADRAPTRRHRRARARVRSGSPAAPRPPPRH